MKNIIHIIITRLIIKNHNNNHYYHNINADYNYKNTNNLKVINFTNFGKIVINFSKKYSINFELCSNLINNAINNLNSNGYMPLMVTALYIELFQVFENKGSSVLNYQSIVDFN